MKEKAFFIVFEGLSFDQKIKIADTGFQGYIMAKYILVGVNLNVDVIIKLMSSLILQKF